MSRVKCRFCGVGSYMSGDVITTCNTCYEKQEKQLTEAKQEIKRLKDLVNYFYDGNYNEEI